MLYRSTDRLCRRGAPVKNLSHSASFESLDKDAPSKPGTKQLGAGKTAADIRDLYLHRGPHIFPPVWDNPLGRAWKLFRNNVLNMGFNRYDRLALERALQEFVGDKLFGESKLRHVIPAFDGRFSEVFLFKTRHHDDYKQDWRMKIADVAMATSAAPTIYRALPPGGYMLIDGGVWANNPLMLAIAEAIIWFVAVAEGDRRRNARAISGDHQPGEAAAWAHQCCQDRAFAYRRSYRDRRLPAGGERAFAGCQRRRHG